MEFLEIALVIFHLTADTSIFQSCNCLLCEMSQRLVLVDNRHGYVYSIQLHVYTDHIIDAHLSERRKLLPISSFVWIKCLHSGFLNQLLQPCQNHTAQSYFSMFCSAV